jgi:hypothetical protein
MGRISSPCDLPSRKSGCSNQLIPDSHWIDSSKLNCANEEQSRRAGRDDDLTERLHGGSGGDWMYLPLGDGHFRVAGIGNVKTTRQSVNTFRPIRGNAMPHAGRAIEYVTITGAAAQPNPRTSGHSGGCALKCPTFGS